MPNKTSRITLMKIIKALIEDNIHKQNEIRDRDIIINGLTRKIERSKV